MSDFTKANVKKYYLSGIFYGFSLTIPITILYYRSFGLSYLEIGLLESIFLATLLTFEIPTGTLADRFGRKWTVVCGALLTPIGTLVMALGSGFAVFAVASIIYGIAMALFSGAETALIYDTLREAEEEKSYILVSGKSWAFFYVFMAIAAPIGSHLFALNPRLPFFIDAAISSFAFWVYLSMREPASEGGDSSQKDTYLAILKNGIKQLSMNPHIRWYVFFGLLISLTLTVFNSTFSQPLLTDQGIKTPQIGFVFSAVAIIQATTSFYAQKIEKKLGEKLALILIFLAPGVAFLAMGVPMLSVVLPFYLAYNLVKGFRLPVLDSYVQRHVSSNSRATVLSIQSFLGSLAGVVFLPVFGYLADQTSVVTGVVALGIVTLIGGFLLLVLKPKADFNTAR